MEELDNNVFIKKWFCHINKTIEVKGQKSHQYIFLIASKTAPKHVEGADKWLYNSEKKEITITKTGIKFKLSIKS